MNFSDLTISRERRAKLMDRLAVCDAVSTRIVGSLTHAQTGSMTDQIVDLEVPGGMLIMVS